MAQKKISPKELEEKMKNKDEKIICVDVRTEVEHNFSHIPGTINFPLDQLHNHLPELKKYDTVVLQCSTGARSQFACNVLPGKGCGDVVSLEGGIAAWEQAGLPVDHAGKARLPLMRQMFLVASTMILLGLLFFMAFDNTWYLVLPLAVGIGMTISGATGICFMTKLLAKMPWNKS